VVFLEILVKGSITLYRYDDRFYVEKYNDNFTELVNKQIESFKDGKRYVRSLNGHRNILKMLMDDCPDIHNKLNYVELYERDIRRIVEKYNKCVGDENHTLKSEKKWIQLSYELNGGFNFTKVHIDPQKIHRYLNSNFKTTTSMTGNLLLGVTSPRLNERISLTNRHKLLSTNHTRLL
jgi:hypothetical protein